MAGTARPLATAPTTQHFQKVISVIQDRNNRELTLDTESNALYTLDFAHHEIHEGDHYFVVNFLTLASAETLDFCVAVPDTTKRIHMLFQVTSTGGTVASVLEDSDFDSDGTAVPAQNNNRNSANSSVLTIETNCTINSAGTAISAQSFGVASTPSKTLGGETRRDDEILLKNNTNYIFRISSLSNDNIISFRANWYEHSTSS